MKITNVTVERGSQYSDYALMWESEGARFHVWLEKAIVVVDDTYELTASGILFKNAPLTLKRSDAGYFQTRRLKLSIPKNKAMFDAALAEAQREGMFAKADDKIATNEQERLARAAAEHKVNLAKQAGPKMLKVLHETMRYFGQADDALDFSELQNQINAAIAEAENGIVE